MTIATGEILAERYRVVQLLGKGGMGKVYEVELVSLPKRLAIKVLIPQLARNKDALKRFRREAELIARLNHPNLVEIIDWHSLPDGTHFYVMELLKGEDLAQRIKRAGPLKVADLAALAQQCFSGLLEAHRQGAVHRDLKPANIFLSETGSGFHTKVIDFGLARARDMASITIYTSPMLIGTPSYMSPEQISGEGPVGEEADAWAMAVLLYEAATGALPFKGRYPDLVKLIGKVAPTSLGELRPDVPPAFAEAISQALDPDPSTRLRSTAVLAERIDKALVGAPSASGPAESAPPPVVVTRSTAAVTKVDKPTPERVQEMSTPSMVAEERAAKVRTAGTRTRYAWAAAATAVVLGAILFAVSSSGESEPKLAASKPPVDEDWGATVNPFDDAPLPAKTHRGKNTHSGSRIGALRLKHPTLKHSQRYPLQVQIRERYQKGIEHCLNNALKKDSRAQGRVSIGFLLRRSGRVTSPIVKGISPSFESCVKLQVLRWKFYLSEDTFTEIEQRFELTMYLSYRRPKSPSVKRETPPSRSGAAGDGTLSPSF